MKTKIKGICKKLTAVLHKKFFESPDKPRALSVRERKLFRAEEAYAAKLLLEHLEESVLDRSDDSHNAGGVFETHAKWEKIGEFERLIFLAEEATKAYEPRRRAQILSEQKQRTRKLENKLGVKAPQLPPTGIGPLRLYKELEV